MIYCERRLFVLHFIFCFLALVASIYFFTIQETMRCILSSFIFINLLFILTVRNRFKIFDDSFVGYAFRGIGILPFIIEFDDLTDYQLVNKHKLQVTYKQKKIMMHIIDASSFYQELDASYIAYQNK